MKPLERLVLTIVLAQVAQVSSAQQISGRFYPEKQSYLVGEPIFVGLDLANTSSGPVLLSISCTWLDTRFESLSTPKPRHEVSLFGCRGGGEAGSCAGGAKQILPGKHYHRRYLLDGSFRLNSPGVYPVRAWHKVDIYRSDKDYQVLASQEIVSEFQVTLLEGDEQALASAYSPLLHDLRSPDELAKSLALSAIVQNPSRFLESAILALADDPQTAVASIPGLKRLATSRAKAKLAELSAAKNAEYIRQMAISALGELGDPAYCSLMLAIAQESPEYSRFIAFRAAGYLCGQKALPFLSRLLADGDSSSRFEVAYALGNSHSREAVPRLVPLLVDPDSNVRRATSDALASLTHRTSKAGIGDEAAAQETYRDWINWWVSNGVTAEIYGIDHCGELMPFR